MLKAGEAVEYALGDGRYGYQVPASERRARLHGGPAQQTDRGRH